MKLEKERGFRSSFNFVAEKYTNHIGLFDELRVNGCEIGLHGLRHHENLFKSYDTFAAQVPRINNYLKKWGAGGFRAPCMYHNLDWMHELDIEYDASTFDTDPFEPQPDGVGTIFPFWVAGNGKNGGYIELPYTLPQDFTLFVLFRERNIDVWKRKLDWIAEKGGMALLITHPDYMTFGSDKCQLEEYPVDYYEEFLDYINSRYSGQYWNPLPKDMAHFWKEAMVRRQT
jgi:peptidoglycan/xylan/chitin deacetylase (PgdA/CDA1 family)